jgi:dipeptidyl-peptidase-4
MYRRSIAAWAFCSTLWACASSEPFAPSAPTPPPLERSSSAQAAGVLPPSASAVDFDAMARFPEPGWGIPRQAAFSPSGKHLSFLASENGSEEMVLWTMPVDAGAPRVLLRASDLVAPGAGRSLAEELRDERQRKRITGITEAYWAREADALVVPAGGDVYVLPSVGAAPLRVTATDEPELDPKLSPDGTMVAYVRGSELYVADIATRRERALTRGAAEGVTRGQSDFNGQEEFDEPSGYWWSPDGRRIAYLEVDERGVGAVPLLGYRGGATLSTPLRYPRAGTANPRVELRVVEVATGKSLAVRLPESLGESPYLGRVRWLPDGEHLALQALTRDQKRRDTLLFDLTTPKRRARVVHREVSASAWVELSELRPLPDGAGLLTILNREGHEHLAVLGLEADLEGGSPLAPRLLTRGDWEVFQLLEVDRDKKLVWVVANRDEQLGRQVLEIDLTSGAARNLTTLPGVHVAQVSARAKAMLDVHSALDRAPRAELVRLDGTDRRELPVVDDRAAIEGLGLRTPTLLEVEHAGVRLHAALLPPRQLVPGGKHPLVLAVYGGPGVQTVKNQWSPRLYWQHLADRGFYVLQVDNRGSAGRGPGFAAPIAGRLGEVELDDQLAVLDRVIAEHAVDPTRVGIYGHSYGGFLSALAMLRHPTRFRAGVAGSPVTDWSLYDTGYTERYLGTPTSNRPGYEASELARLAGQLRGELFIVHALLDENVHFEHTARLVDALVAADRDFDLLVFPGERHGYRSPTARRYALRRVIDHLVLHLGNPDAR